MITPSQIAPTAKRRKNIVFVHDTTKFGGLEMVVLDLLRHLDTSRFHPAVMVPGYHEPDFASPAEFIERVRAINIPILRPPHPGHQPILTTLIDVRNMVRLFRSAQTDIVHIHTARVEGARKATLSARLAGVPVVMRTEHSSPTAFGSASMRSNQTRFFDLLTHLIITVSEHDRQEQIECVGRTPKKVYRIYNGVDITRFQHEYDQCSVKYQLGFDPNIPLVGTVGRLSEEKGHQYFVEAAATVLHEFSQVQFLLVGSGDLGPQLKAQAAALGIADQVHFVGYQPDPVPYIEAMDVAVMPSLHEGFSISLLEFMALGKPSVVTDHPGLAEASIHGTTGLVVARRDSAALADGILRLLRDPTRARTMGQAAQRHVIANFTFDRYMNDIMSLYDKLF